MNYNEMKVWLLSTAVFTVSFTQIDNVLKITLLLVSIGYSVDKWLRLRKNNNKKDNDD